MVGIYRFVNKYNRKSYIGKSKNIEQRYRNHIYRANKGECSYFYNAIRKWNINSFDFEILYECPVEQLDYWEKFYIKYYCSNNKLYGYNITEGGTGTSVWTNEMRKKMSNSTIKRFQNKEERVKVSNAAKKRFEDPAEREKVRQEQLKRLEDPEYRIFLSEIGKKGAEKRTEILKEDSDKYNNMRNKISLKRKEYFNKMSKEDKDLFIEKNRQAQLKYWSTHEGSTKGKHKVWNDEAHSGYHYE